MSKRNGATNGAAPDTIELNGLDRVLLLEVLPGSGSLLTIRVLHDFRQALGLTDAEMAAHGITPNQPTPYAVLEQVPPKPIEIGAVRRDLIVAGLRALDKAQQVGMHHLSLFEKFPIGAADE